MNELHAVQMQILRELLFHPRSRFSDLNLKGLSNDHFSYHIKTLLEKGFVVKENEVYSLTLEGKEYANRMDTDQNKIEKQPKVSVIVIPQKEINGVMHYAIQTRQKEPYYGYKGFMSGKIRFGETVFEAAARELSEEMGLRADYAYTYILHEMVYDKTGRMLEDKFFHVVGAQNVQGELQVNHEAGINEWMTEDQFLAAAPKFHNEVEIYHWFKKGDTDFKEEKYVIDGF